MNKNVDI